MATLKTTPNKADVGKFLAAVKDEQRRKDCQTLVRLMKKATGAEPQMWGSSIVGFGKYHYVYASGREGDWFLAGFSPRKQNLTVYIMAGLERFPAHLKKLGKHKTGKGCLYMNSLADVDLDVLAGLVKDSSGLLRRKYNS